MRRGTYLMRLRDERVSQMKAEHWSRVNVRGIAPYTIDRVDGTYQVEFDRTGRSMPVCEWHDVPVRAYDVRRPDGGSKRFARLKDAKAYIEHLRSQSVTPVIPQQKGGAWWCFVDGAPICPDCAYHPTHPAVETGTGEVRGTAHAGCRCRACGTVA